MKKLRVEKGEDQGRGRGLKHSFCPVALFQGSTLRSLPDSILELGLSSHSEQCFSEFDVLTRYLEVLFNADSDSVKLKSSLQVCVSNKL